MLHVPDTASQRLPLRVRNRHVAGGLVPLLPNRLVAADLVQDAQRATHEPNARPNGRRNSGMRFKDEVVNTGGLEHAGQRQAGDARPCDEDSEGFIGHRGW